MAVCAELDGTRSASTTHKARIFDVRMLDPGLLSTRAKRGICTQIVNAPCFTNHHNQSPNNYRNLLGVSRVTPSARTLREHGPRWIRERQMSADPNECRETRPAKPPDRRADDLNDCSEDLHGCSGDLDHRSGDSDRRSDDLDRCSANNDRSSSHLTSCATDKPLGCCPHGFLLVGREPCVSRQHSEEVRRPSDDTQPP